MGRDLRVDGAVGYEVIEMAFGCAKVMAKHYSGSKNLRKAIVAASVRLAALRRESMAFT